MAAGPAGGVVVERLDATTAEHLQRRAAGALLRAGCRPGDRVAFPPDSSAAMLCSVLGATRVGVVPVLLHATLLTAERERLLADADPVLVVRDRAGLAALADGPPAELAPWPLARPMHYTSGTTGRPKGVYVAPMDERTASAAFDDEADLWGFDADDVHLVCSPLHHSVSIRFAGGTLLRGGSVLVQSRFDAGATLRRLRTDRPTTTFMAPTHLQRLLAAAGLDAGERFGSLRLLVHAGSPCPPVLKRAAMERVATGALWEFYGATEGQFTVCSPGEWLERPGTVGRARPGRRLWIEPVGADGCDRAPEGAGAPEGGQAHGTVWCEAPGFARFAYWRDPVSTAAASKGCAFTVGDLGHLDDDGYLFLSGRRDDLIISGGVNVYPAEVEAVLAAVPGVVEVAVFARPDPEWGERVCAAVVGGRNGLVTETALAIAAGGALAPYKRPKEYHLCSSLPHTATGKLVRRQVAARLGLDGASGG